MGKFIDLTGQRFGRLVVIEFSHTEKNNNKSRKYWKCKCDCGNEIIVRRDGLTSLSTQSCGCLHKDISHKKFIDLTNKRFGKLTVEGFDHRQGKLYYWKCKCDCGNIKIISGSALRNHHTLSCGCYQKEKVTKEYGVASFHKLFSRYKCSASKRNIEFNLTETEFKEITNKPCYYCGETPKSVIVSKSNNGNYIYNGIDRIDSTKEYSINNVIPCCGRCNEGKMEIPQQDFLSWVERVYNYSIKGEKNE